MDYTCISVAVNAKGQNTQSCNYTTIIEFVTYVKVIYCMDSGPGPE